MPSQGDTFLETKSTKMQRKEGDMKPNPSKAEPKGLILQNRTRNITRLRKKNKESKTNLYAEMHINLRSGSHESQYSLKTKQHEPPLELN